MGQTRSLLRGVQNSKWRDMAGGFFNLEMTWLFLLLWRRHWNRQLNIYFQRQHNATELNWTEMAVQLLCTDCTKWTNWTELQYDSKVQCISVALQGLYNAKFPKWKANSSIILTNPQICMWTWQNSSSLQGIKLPIISAVPGRLCQ